MMHLPLRSGRWSFLPPTRSLALPLLLLIVASTACAQLQVSLSSDDRYDSNPNRIGKKERASGSLDDLLGSQALTLGYDIGLAPGVSLDPAYTLGITLWGNDSRQNFLQHDLSLVYDNRNVALLHHPIPASPSPAPLPEDTVKEGLVKRIYAVAGYLAEAKLTVASPPAESQIDTSYLEKLEEPEDDLDILFGDDSDTVDIDPGESLTGGESPATRDSLKSRMAERLLDIADSLDLADGSQELVDSTMARIRAYQGALDAAFPGEPLVAGTTMRLDSLLQSLARYIPPGEEAEEDLGIVDEWDLIYAPVALGFQPLMRNALSDYGLFTVESDAGADILRLSASVSRGSYLATGDTDLARYDNTTVDGGALLQQQLGRGFNAWLAYDITHEAYPNEPLFENTRNSFTAQLRYQPSSRVLVALDAEYALKSYQDDLSPATVRRPRRPARQVDVAVDSAALTSLFQVGLGMFYRPWEESSIGIAVAHQSTPALHPRLLIGTSAARAGIGAVNSVQSTLSDDIFSWNGSDLQLVVMQGLPWEIVGSLRYDYNPRDYGRMTVTINNSSIKLQDRQDIRRTFELGLTRDFYIDLGERSSVLTVGLSLGQVSNSSTNFSNRAAVLASYDFNFTESYAGVSLQWGMW